jgi:hypothetical protein
MTKATFVNHFEKINPTQHNFIWHMIFLHGFIKFDQGISEKRDEKIEAESGIIRIIIRN